MSTVEPDKLCEPISNINGLSVANFVDIQFIDSGKHRYLHRLRARNAQGMIMSDIIKDIPHIANLHIRKDGLVTWSVPTSPGRMFSTPLSTLQWMGKEPTINTIVFLLEQTAGKIMELDRINGLLDALGTNTANLIRYQGSGLDLLRYMKCPTILDNLHCSNGIGMTDRLTKAGYKYYITTLKRIGILVYEGKLMKLPSITPDAVYLHLYPKL